jgi:long-chain acyl-CoA synthetase
MFYLQVVEGYGQTECVAPVSLTVQGDHVPEHVGPPVACCCVKLVDVPEMEYYAANGQGEVCVKGTNVFQGYYKEDEKTSETIDSDGWHHTGDVGMWLPVSTVINSWSFTLCRHKKVYHIKTLYPACF